MSNRPGSASALVDPTGATNRAPRTAINASANIPITGVPMPSHGARHGSSSNTNSHSNKNFGPPTLQSDTVVFQTAKIPLSSARLSSAPPGRGVASARGASGMNSHNHYTRRDHAIAIDSHHPRELYGHPHAPVPSHHQQPHPHPQNHHSLLSRHPASHGFGDSPMGVAPPQQLQQLQQQQQQRRPRSPPSLASRDHNRGGGSGGALCGPSTSSDVPAHATTNHTSNHGEFTHLLMDEPSRSSRNSRARSMQEEISTTTATHPAPTSKKAKTSHRSQRGQPKSKSKTPTKPQALTPRRVVRLTIRVIKDGDKLGFGIRNDSNRKLKVSTLQSNSTAAKSPLQIGDTILTVNGIDLTHLGFLEVIQQLKATRPGELVFDIERSLDDDGGTSTAHNGDDNDDGQVSGAESGSSQQGGETMDLDSPLSVAERRFGPAAVAMREAAMANAAAATTAGLTISPSQIAASQNNFDGAPMTPPAHQAPRMDQRTPPPARTNGRAPPQLLTPASMAATGAVTTASTTAAPAEPPRKRPRPSGMTPHQLEIEMVKLDKQHKAVVTGLSMELKKERTERLSLEDKNGALRKRLQNMLIECDEVRVKASSSVAAIKDQTERETGKLKQLLEAAKAQLRLHDRGPDVKRTDSIIRDLMAAKDQLSRLRKLEMDRATGLSNRYSLESRLSEREAHRTRDTLISLFQTQLRDAARRHYTNSGAAKSSDNKKEHSVVVQLEGLRRLAFVKMFGLPCSYEWYTSDDYVSTAAINHALLKPDDVLDVFGNALCHEERAGLFLVAAAPMTVAYDPSIEKLTLSCAWVEQNQIRELARNFRF